MGSLTLNGATSGQITLNPPAVAGTNTLTLPAATGTLVYGTQPSGTIVGTTDTQTLTNKTLTTPTIAQINSAASATPTIFADSAGTQVGTLCRAWANFVYNGTSITTNASFNVSSITRTGAGNYTLTFTNNMTDANFATVFSQIGQGGSGPYNSTITFGYQTNAANVQTTSTILMASAYSAFNAGGSNYTDQGTTAKLSVAVFR